MIRIDNIWKTFADQAVLCGVNLDIDRGETIVIIGQSGCGKSVLLKHLIGLMRPDKGKIFIDGVEITNLTRAEIFNIRKKFGMLFQGAALFDSMTVEENLTLGIREHTQMKNSEMKTLVREKLSLVGLPDTEEMNPSDLSGGMKKRVGLARALMMNPEVLLFDEPTTGLDPIMADVINELIISCSQNLGVTSIVVTHDIQSAYKVGHRIAMLYNGRIVFDGSPEEVQHTPSPVVKQFVQGLAEGPIRAI